MSNFFRIISSILFVFFFVLVGFGIFNIVEGFDKKDHYYNSEYTSYSTNAYVGGDAYNYIINGTYFTGYIVLGSMCIISGFLSLSTSLIIKCMLYCQKENLASDKNEALPEL